MANSTDISPPADDSGITSEQPKDSRSRPTRLNQALAWVGIVAGGLFVVATIFFSGVFLSWSLHGQRAEQMGPGSMACCSHPKPGEMGQGAIRPSFALEPLTHEHPFVTRLGAAAGFLIADGGIKALVLCHRLVRVKADFTIPLPHRFRLGKSKQPSA